MSMERLQLDEKSRIHQLINGWAEAAQDRDIEALMSSYAPDVVAFDAVKQLRVQGIEAYRREWEFGFTMSHGPMVFQIRDLDVSVGGDVAFCHFLVLCGGTDEDGQTQTSWMRASMGCRREDGEWRIAHDHFSVPFDMESGAGLFQLQP